MKLFFRWFANAVILVTVAGCGGGGGGGGAVDAPTEPSRRDLRTDVQVPGFPHPVDVYVSDAPERIVIFLHGGGGTKERFAYNMGVTASDAPPTLESTNWSWLNARRVVAVFPQGQTATGSPLAATWSNHVMTSGADDVAFLLSLADAMRTTYGEALPVSVVGHSNGAMMANRLWCEAPSRFSVFVAFAGPSSVHYLATPCAPSVVRPYLGFVGDQDTQLEGSENWSQAQWRIRFDGARAVVNPNLIGEWAQFVGRASSVCAENPGIGDGIVAGSITTWQACSARLRVQRGAGLDHGLGAPSAVNPTILSDRALDFVVDQEGR